MVDIKELMECSEIHEETLRFDSPSFDTAIVGIDYFGRLIYDYDRMIAELNGTLPKFERISSFTVMDSAGLIK